MSVKEEMTRRGTKMTGQRNGNKEIAGMKKTTRKRNW
jgi:hypothetical protein